MTASSSLYRKYRSQTFDELVGQEPVVRTLKNAIATGRISHAYLFTGPRGVGKTSAARLLARAANCLTTEGEKPCNKCANCLAATRDIATDLIEIDAASNTGVDNIRDVIERANFAPSIWNTKFYIVDEVHMLSTSAFNALLKTLEEPPAHTAFVLATTEVHKVPATVASRCQRFDFRRVPLKAMVARVKYICEQEGIEAEDAALELVARHATGSLRDALSLLDQLRVYAEKTITLESVQEMLGAGGSEEVAAFVDTLLAADMADGLRRVNTISEEGRDLRQFNRQVVEHLRDLMLVKSGAAQSEGVMLDVTDEMRSRLRKQAEGVSIPDLLRWIKVFGDADASLRSTVYGQLPLEMALVEAILKPGETAPRGEVRDRSAEVASGIEHIGVVPARPKPAPGAPARQTARQPQQPSTTLPPPIHTELAAMAGNGSHDHEDLAPAPTAERKQAQPVEEPMPVAPEPEQPETAQTPAAPLAAPSADLEQLISLWPDVVAQINARSKAMAAQFGNSEMVRPLRLENNLCTIGFRHQFHAEKCRVSPYRDILEGALSRVLGYKCISECVTFEQGVSGDAPERSPARKSSGKNAAREKPSPYDTTRGKAAMNIFGIEKFDEN